MQSLTIVWHRTLMLGAFMGCLATVAENCLWAQAAGTLTAPAATTPTTTPSTASAAEPAAQVQESGQRASSDKAAATASTTAAAAGETPEFVRVHKVDGEPQALQTAVASYRKQGDNSGLVVDLIGAVHIGEPEYYRELNKLFKSYDALLYEMVTDPELGIPDPEERGVSPVSTIQVGMKEMLELTFQLDEVDYKAANFVHADMTPAEFFDTMNSRKESVLKMFFQSLGSGIAMQSAGRGGDVGLLAALVSENRAQGLRRAFADQMQMMDGQMAALTGEDGKSTLITERNAKAFEVMDREIKSGKKKIGIFYGAGHLKDMHERLVKQYGMQLVETKWLDAWGL